MKKLAHKRLITILLSLSFLLSSLPSNIILAEEQIPENEIIPEVTSEPERAAKDLVEEREDVVFPIEEAEPTKSEDIVDTELEKKERIFVEEAEDMPRNQFSTKSVSSSPETEKALYNVTLLQEQEYQAKNSGNLTINKATGNVNYSYNLATIPGKNGSTMSLNDEQADVLINLL